MEGTQSNDNKRKRRSSILKSQRVSRTPFSELEFKVNTPPENTKSRRVSFSRKTGVAEFVTNEATTTWKTFYEEQNRSHESSDHEAVNQRPYVGHIGNRLFEQQFEEIEAEIDFGNAITVPTNNANNSVNVTEQLALLDTTNDIVKLAAPQRKFDLSSFTEHSKVFNDLTNPVLGEMSQKIDVNFSVITPIGKDDDLDEIERDLKFEQSHVVGPAFGNDNQSHYIELDYNTTRGLIRDGNGSDMSITDTIKSPKKELTHVSLTSTTKSSQSNVRSWVEDKENIVVNPYVAPETDYVKTATEKVLVFDGKKVQYADIDANLDAIIEDSDNAPHKVVAKANGDKTVVFNDETGLGDMSVTKVVSTGQLNKTGIFNDDGDMSITTAVPVGGIDRTNIFNDDGDMSITKAVPVATIDRTKFFCDDLDMSITTALPVAAINKTNIFNDDGDMSITKAVPVGVIDRTKVCTDDLDMSITMAVPVEGISKNNIFNDKLDMSLTTVVPTGVINRSEVYNGEGDMSITRALPTGNFNKTLICTDNANMSITRVIPSRSICNVIDNNSAPEVSDKNKSINDQNITADMSMTKVIPSADIIANIDEITTENLPETLSEVDNKNTAVIEEDNAQSGFAKTNLFNDEITVADMSIRDAVPHFSQENRRKTILFDDLDADVSMTECIPPASKTVTDTVKEEPDASKISIAHSIVHDLWCQNEPIENLKTMNDMPFTTVAPINVRKSTINNTDTDLIEGISESFSSISNENSSKSSNEDQNLKRQLLTTLRRSVDRDEIPPKRTLPVEILESVMVSEGVPTKKAIIPDSFVPDQSLKIPRPVPEDSSLPSTIISNLGAEINMSNRRIIAFEQDSTTQVSTKCDPISGRSEVLEKESRAGVSVIDTMSIATVKPPYGSPQQKRFDRSLLNDTTTLNNKSNVVVCQAADLGHLSVNDLVNSILHDNGQLNRALPGPIKSVLDTITDKETPTVNVLIMNVVNPDYNKDNTPGDSDNSVLRDDLPSNKGDEFHASSDKMTGTKVQLNNPHYTLHSRNAPKVLSKKKPELAESNDEQKIKSISYDALAASSTHTEPLSDDKLYSAKFDLESVLRHQEDNCHYRRKMEEGRAVSPLSGTTKRCTKLATDVKLDSKRAVLDTLLDMSDSCSAGFCDERDAVTSTGNMFSASGLTIGESETKLHDYHGGGSSATFLSSDSGSRVIPFITSPQRSTAASSDTNTSIDTIQKAFTDTTEQKSLAQHEENETEIKNHENMDVLQTVDTKMTFDVEDDVATVESSVTTSVINSTQFTKPTNESSASTSIMDDKSGPDINADDTADLLEILSNLTDKTLIKNVDKYEIESQSITSNSDREIKRKSLNRDDKKTISHIPLPIDKSPNHRSKTCKSEDSKENTNSSEDSEPKNDDISTIYSSESNEGSSTKNEAQNEIIVANDATARPQNEAKPEVSKNLFKKICPDLTEANHKNKAKVIPSYMISDGIKELMDDLIKPMADVLPYRSTNPGVNDDHPSTCSVQLQANINPPSQIDLAIDSESSSQEMTSLPSVMSSIGSKKIVIDSQVCTHNDILFIPPTAQSSTFPEKVVVFDLSNPLNNVLLGPIDMNAAHNYQPIVTSDVKASDNAVNDKSVVDNPKADDETENEIANSNANLYEHTTEVGRVIVKYNFDSNKTIDKPNQEETKLVFVSGAPTDTESSVDKTTDDSESYSEIVIERRITRTRKRSFSPSCKSTSETDPNFKKHRNRSTSLRKTEQCDDQGISIKFAEEQKSPKNKSPNRVLPRKRKSISPDRKSTSSWCTAFECPPSNDGDIMPELDKPSDSLKTGNDCGTAIDNESLTLVDDDSTMMCATENSFLDVIDNHFVTKLSIEKRKESDFESFKRKRSPTRKDDITRDCEFNNIEDITHKINQLKFLGNHIWSWERRSGDKWSFLLLRGRIRFCVVFASSDIKPGTRVTVTLFEPTQTETLNHLSSLCVRYALGAMRAAAARLGSAAELPHALLRCAGVSRLATQWLRAMWDARARLGYRVKGDELVFKVANVPLRSVWEVSVRVSLAAHAAGPYPRADPPRVRAVVAAAAPPRLDAGALVDALPTNWGHVPKAVWRVFKLLKDKVNDDDMLLNAR